MPCIARLVARIQATKLTVDFVALSDRLALGTVLRCRMNAQEDVKLGLEQAIEYNKE